MSSRWEFQHSSGKFERGATQDKGNGIRKDRITRQRLGSSRISKERSPFYSHNWVLGLTCNFCFCFQAFGECYCQGSPHTRISSLEVFVPAARAVSRKFPLSTSPHVATICEETFSFFSCCAPSNQGLLTDVRTPPCGPLVPLLERSLFLLSSSRPRIRGPAFLTRSAVETPPLCVCVPYGARRSYYGFPIWSLVWCSGGAVSGVQLKYVLSQSLVLQPILTFNQYE